MKEPRDLGGQGGGEGVCGANFAVEEAERERREEVEQGLGGSHERGVPAPGEVTWWVVTAARLGCSGGLNHQRRGVGVWEIWSPVTPCSVVVWCPVLERAGKRKGSSGGDLERINGSGTVGGAGGVS